MLSVTVIVVVAVAGVVGLVVVAVLLAVTIERRRHWRLMEQHGLNRHLSIHRPTLSVNEQNYAHVPRPNNQVRSRGRPARLTMTWTTVPSEETIAPELSPEEPPIDHDPMLPNAKQRKSLKSSLHGYSFNVPKTPRQKKIQKAISLNQMPQSPLSAITEFTDNDMPFDAELPVEITPKATPDRPPRSPESLHIAKTRTAKAPSQEFVNSATNERVFTRSVSMTSTLTAPAQPLPPLPVLDIYKSQRHNEPWRNSTASLDTVGSSVLGTVFSSPSRVGTDLTVPSTNLDGMQTFDFGFDDFKSSARLGVPPGRQTMQGFCSGKSGISSTRPSVEYYNGRAICLDSAFHKRLKAYHDNLRTIDASNWNSQSRSISAGNHARHSMQDYGRVLGKRNHLDTSFGASPQPILRRPASVASGNPYQWDLKQAFSNIRNSAGSNDVKRGHKRQNCVRISNLPVAEARNSRIEPMPELREEQSETPNSSQVKIPGLTLLEAGQPVLRARPSLVDVKGSPSPLHNRPVLVPTKPKRSLRTSNSSAGSARPDSDVFSTGQPDPKTLEPFKHFPRLWPLSPTSRNNIKLNAPSPSYDSPTLPSPINAANLFPRKSRIMGPRNPPASGLPPPRTGSPSPIGTRPAQKRVAPDDLRKSIMALRSMNSEGRLLDAPSSRNYRTIIGDEREDLSGNFSLSPTMTSPNSTTTHAYPRERRYGSAAFGARSNMSIAVSPSGMSLGGTSIWEDASVRGDFPEPEVPTVPSTVLVLEDVDDAASQAPRTPKSAVPYPDPEAYENMYAKGQGGGRFVSPQGKGLGLRVGNRVLGTPASLYDRDGFLKE